MKLINVIARHSIIIGLFAAVSASTAEIAKDPAGTITCEISLTMESEALEAKRTKECTSMVRMCNEHGLYDVAGPTLVSDGNGSIDNSWEYYDAWTMFDADGKAATNLEGLFMARVSYSFHRSPRPEALGVHIDLHLMKDGIPRTNVEYDLSPTGGLPMKLGDEVRLTMENFPRSGLNIPQIHGDDVLRRVTMVCRRLH